METTLHDALLGSQFSYTTLYRPVENSIDVFETLTPYTMTLPSGFVLDRSDWTATASSDATHKNDGGKAQVVLDNNFDTYWHSSWSPNEPLPHWVLVDMKKEYVITEVSIYKRKDNTDCKKVEIYISADGESFNLVGTLEYQKTASPNGLTLALKDPLNAKFLKCVITESYREPFASLSEIKVSGRPAN